MCTGPEASQAGGRCYVVPARTLRGSRAEMLAEIEEVVMALLALRLVILTEVSPPQSSSPANR
jgi:hypothetical protein